MNDTKKTFLIFGVVAIGGGLVLALLCAGFFTWASSAYDAEAKQAMQRNATVRTHLGVIELVEGNDLQASLLPGPWEFVYDVTASKGSGTIYANYITLSSGHEQIEYGFLDMKEKGNMKRYNLNNGRAMEIGVLPVAAMDDLKFDARHPMLTGKINRSMEEPIRDFKESPTWQNYIKSRDRRREVVGLLPGERATMTEEEIQKYEPETESKQ